MSPFGRHIQLGWADGLDSDLHPAGYAHHLQQVHSAAGPAGSGWSLADCARHSQLHFAAGPVGMLQAAGFLQGRPGPPQRARSQLACFAVILGRGGCWPPPYGSGAKLTWGSCPVDSSA